MNKTIEYYDEHSELFIGDTFDADMSAARSVFLKDIPEEGLILDLGCGSGRDSKAFLQAGYRVDSLDGSKVLCESASKILQRPVMHKRFDELDDTGKYDGIWACASLLHVPSDNISDIIQKIFLALKPNGVFYMSVKKGTFEGCRNGRYFTDYTEERIVKMLAEYPFQLIRFWESNDVRPEKEEIWLNVLVKKLI